MKRTHLLAVLISITSVALLAADAQATHHPTLGRFLQRDPGPGGGSPARIGAAGPVAGGSFAARDPVGGQYADGMNLYQYVSGNPTGFADPQGLNKGPCTIKQISGADGDGSVNRGLHLHLFLIRHSHLVRDAGGSPHKLGHTWLSCAAGGNSLSTGFYPMSNKKTIFPGPGKVWGVNDPGTAEKNNKSKQQGKAPSYKPYDPLDAPGMTDFWTGKSTSHDWEWETDVPDRPLPPPSGGGELQYGEGRGKRCCAATDADIIDCVRRFSIVKALSGKWWDASFYHCQDFVLDALDACCMQKGKRRGPLAGPRRRGD